MWTLPIVLALNGLAISMALNEIKDQLKRIANSLEAKQAKEAEAQEIR